MQDAATRQKTGPQFVLPIPPGTEPSRDSNPSFFEIIPHTPEKREKIVEKFDLETKKAQRPNVNASVASPKLSELLINAETLLLHGEKSLARILVYEALKKDSKNPLALKKARVFLNREKDLDKLIELQREICKVEVSFENTMELGHLLYLKNEDELALKYYHEALNLVYAETPCLFDVYKNMGNIFTRGGDYEAAEEYFHKAFTIKPESDVLAVNLGTLSIQKHDYDSALQRFRSAVTKNPKNDKAWVGLALVHQEMADIQLAFANVETAIDLNPSNRTAVHLFANWCIRERKYQPAIEVVENFLASVEVDAEISLVLVHLFCKLNQMDLAKMEVERVLLWLPEHPQMNAIHKELSQLNPGSFL